MHERIHPMLVRASCEGEQEKVQESATTVSNGEHTVSMYEFLVVSSSFDVPAQSCCSKS
uniref:Uncharacterized protein n=1 Tax=Solanum lycopersicum TaxID=4081 RepID=A0A3Q7EE13_SOLLC